MNPQDVETAALLLPPTRRAQLAARLLESLEELSEAELDAAWAAEATRRDTDFDRTPDLGREAKDVLAEARERLA